MGRALLVLDTPEVRAKAVHWIGKAPEGTRVEFKASKRTLPQNDMLWALLTEVSQQLDHGGTKYDPAQWKAIFLHAFGREVSFLPSLDRKTFLPLELSSSDLSKDEMTDFIEFIMKEASERGVVFKDHRQIDNTNSGEAPLPEPDTADDTSTLVDQAADGEGKTTASPSAAALTGVQRASMIECCRKMLAIPAQTDLDQSQKLIVLAEAKDDWKSMTKPAVHENIKGFYESAKAQIKADPRVYPNLRAKAFDLFSEVLDCEAKELGA